MEFLKIERLAVPGQAFLVEELKEAVRQALADVPAGEEMVRSAAVAYRC